MDNSTKEEVISLYKKGHSIRQISKLIDFKYKREAIRECLKMSKIMMRGKGIIYKNYKDLTLKEGALFSELLGYFYGDGSLHKYKDPSHGIYDCNLTFSLNENDLVERVVYITKRLFEFIPKVIKKKNSFYVIKFRRSFAKYLKETGYPSGKKSEINPHLPMEILKNDLMKKHFVCGFLNAECTVNKTVSVQQSVRIKLPKELINALKQGRKAYQMGKTECYFVKWSEAKSLLDSGIPKSNALTDLNELLSYFKINSKIYPVRVYIGKKDKIGVHYELQILHESIKKIKDFNMLSCTKKVEKLNNLLRE